MNDNAPFPHSPCNFINRKTKTQKRLSSHKRARLWAPSERYRHLFKLHNLGEEDQEEAGCADYCKYTPLSDGKPQGEKCPFDEYVWVRGACWGVKCQWGQPVILGTRSFTWNAPNVLGAYEETLIILKQPVVFFEHFFLFFFPQPSTSRKRLLEGEPEDAGTTKRLAVCAAVSWTLAEHERNVSSWTLLTFSLYLFFLEFVF